MKIGITTCELRDLFRQERIPIFFHPIPPLDMNSSKSKTALDHSFGPFPGRSDSTIPRWKWMLGAAAAGSTTMGGSVLAEVVQITLGTSVTGPDNASLFQLDLTGDGMNDLRTETAVSSNDPRVYFRYEFMNQSYYNSVGSLGPRWHGKYGVFAELSTFILGGAYAVIRRQSTMATSITYQKYSAYVNGANSSNATGPVPSGTVSALIPFTFSDARINGNTPTQGFLDVTSFNVNRTTHVVQIVRLVFDDESTSPPAGVAAGGNNTEWSPPPPPAPEIEVLGNSIPILDGDTTPSPGDLTDFGDAVIGTPLVRSFQIENSGTADLTITSAEADPGDFMVGSVPGTVNQGTTVNFDITFTPNSLGPQTATITITSDDADEGTYTFDITGNGVVPPTNVTVVAPADPNLVAKTILSRKIKKFKKKLKKAKKSGNSGKARAIKSKLKKFKKKLKQL